MLFLHTHIVILHIQVLFQIEFTMFLFSLAGSLS